MKETLNVHLYVTDKCNLQCNHCYNAKWVNNNKSDKYLSLPEVNKIVAILYKNYNVDFHIEGGEIFMWKDINEFLEKLDDNILNKITLTTNGTIDMSLLNHRLKNLNRIRVSVCGHTDRLQKMLRNIPLKKVLHNVDLFRNENIPINLRMTLHKGNFREIFNSIEYFICNNHKDISIYEFQSVGRGIRNESKFLLSEYDFIEFLGLLSSQHFVKNLDSFNINFNSSRVGLIRQYKQKLESVDLKVKEFNNNHSLTVNYNGEIGICPWILGEDKLSNYNDEIFQSQIEYYFVNNFLLHKCEHCSSISISK